MSYQILPELPPLGNASQIFGLNKGIFLFAPKGFPQAIFQTPKQLLLLWSKGSFQLTFFSSCVLLTPSNVAIFKEVQVLNTLTYLQAFIWPCNSDESVPGCPECFHRKEWRERPGFSGVPDKFGHLRFCVSRFKTLFKKTKQTKEKYPNLSLVQRLCSVTMRLLQNISD